MLLPAQDPQLFECKYCLCLFLLRWWENFCIREHAFNYLFIQEVGVMVVAVKVALDLLLLLRTGETEKEEGARCPSWVSTPTSTVFTRTEAKVWPSRLM